MSSTLEAIGMVAATHPLQVVLAVVSLAYALAEALDLRAQLGTNGQRKDETTASGQPKFKQAA
jgi:hypothetical protein